MTRNLSYFEKYKSLKRLYEIKTQKIKNLDPEWEETKRLKEEIAYHKREMEQIKSSIDSYVPSDVSPRVAVQMNDERIFLECRYIQGMTMEKTADAMCVSRDTAYRIRRRIISRYSGASVTSNQKSL